MGRRGSTVSARWPETVTVVGAGMAGAACARALADAGIDIRLYDKGRSVGGRMAQRRVEQGMFDHGAQYLSARDPSFAVRVAEWRRRGIVADWPES
jgi:renalase